MEPSVIVVGAGPAGLLLALLLARSGISVQVLDKSTKLDDQPRATHYSAPAVYELRRAGILDDVRAQGFSPDAVCWRKLDGTYLTGLDNTVLSDYEDRMVCLPLNHLGQVIYKNLQVQSLATVSWDHDVVAIGQDADKAWADVVTSTHQETRRLFAPYIVGCDGANSQVRRALFGDWKFPGKTWDQQLVATNTFYDFSRFGWKDANFIIHPEHFYMAARISNDGLWRVTYGEKGGLTREELLERQPEKFRQILPGHPEPSDYQIVSISPYKVHQRLAESMRVGRFLLAADAAHLCNPFGGLGLTGGLVDVGGLFDCLKGIFDGRADDTILDKYSEVRRAKYQSIVNPISSENIIRLFSADPDTVLQTDEFFQMCIKAEKDPVFARELQLGVNGLQHDFTQYYQKESRDRAGTDLG